MSLSTSGMRVMITGAVSGIGKTIAEMFLESGAIMFIGDISNENLDTCRTDLPGIDRTLTDVFDLNQAGSFFEERQTFLGGLDVLVNNAGIAGPIGSVEDLQRRNGIRPLP